MASHEKARNHRIVFPRLLCGVVSAALIIQTGCIHVQSSETAEVAVHKNDEIHFSTFKSSKALVENIVYTPGKVPLGDFFSRLTDGQFTAAFQQINFQYQPAKTDNKALTALLSAGIVPVYVRITNNDTGDFSVAEKDFILTNGKKSFKAIKAENLPAEFKKFNPAAVGANIYNASVVVVSAAALVAVMVLIAGSGGHQDLSSLGSSADGKTSDDIFNETSNTVKIDYNDYLLTTQNLASKQFAKGLLFFRVGKEIDSSSLRLVLSRSSPYR